MAHRPPRRPPRRIQASDEVVGQSVHAPEGLRQPQDLRGVLDPLEMMAGLLEGSAAGRAAMLPEKNGLMATEHKLGG